MPHHPIDVHVGTRMRQRRALLGMSQTTLGEAVGLTFQQVQKYERGANRISASRLAEFGKVLDVPIAYFFDELPAAASGSKAKARTQAEPAAKDPMVKRETLELVRAFYKIREPDVRKRVADLVKAVASGSEEAPAKRSAKSRRK